MKYYFLAVVFFLLPLTGQAVGISISPSTLELLYPQTTTEVINITNISQEPIAVFVSSDDFVDNFVVTPTEFRLLPDEVGQVRISSDFGNQVAGIKQTNLSVVSKAVDKRSFNAASGIKIPMTAYITESYFEWSGSAVFVITFLGLFLLAMIGQVIFWFIKKKKKHRRWLGIDLSRYHKKRKIFFGRN